MRKTRRVDDSIEFFSVKRAEDSIARCDIAILVLDAESGIIEQDKKIADKIVEERKDDWIENITVIAIQRAIHKVLIAVFLSREFKHDETNRAWWTGRWYGRGLGSHAMSQPAREFVVKTIELSLWSSDLLLGHFLLFMMTPPILIPYVDRFHATLLCKWFSLCARHNFNLHLSLAPSI